MDREWEELFGAVSAGTITPAESARLDRLLAADPDARQAYLEYMDLCASLRRGQVVRGLKPEPTNSVQSGYLTNDARSRRNPWRHGSYLLRAAWAATFVAGLAVAAVFYGRPVGPPVVSNTDGEAAEGAALPGNDETVAVLSRAIQDRWDTVPPPRVGSGLSTGRVQLRSGIVQLEFYTGAVVVVEGPADFDLVSAARVYCRTGKMRAWVPPQAEGFAIDSPVVDLVDRGTEFGIRVDAAGGAEVHVFQGRVEWQNAKPERDRKAQPELTTGAGLRIDPTGAWQPIAADSEAFVSTAVVEQQLRRQHARQYRDWLTLARDLSADPRVVLYYTFQDQPLWGRVTRNLAPAVPRASDGAIIGCQWVTGRWPDKRALDFKTPSDRVRIHVPRTFTSLTFLAWVRVDAFERALSALLLSDWHAAGAPHWQFTERGKLRLGIIGPAGSWGGAGWHDYDSPVVLRPERLGQWVQFATVYDGRAGAVSHYVGGQPVSRESIDFPMTLRIGDAEVGNWEVGSWNGPRQYRIRNLNGRIDEIVVFGEALAPEEIHRLYERGKPGS